MGNYLVIISKKTPHALPARVRSKTAPCEGIKAYIMYKAEQQPACSIASQGNKTTHDNN